MPLIIIIIMPHHLLAHLNPDRVYLSDTGLVVVLVAVQLIIKVNYYLSSTSGTDQGSGISW